MSSDAHQITGTLRTLHRIHRQLGDLREQLARGPRLSQAHAANVQRLEAALADAKAQLTAAKIRSHAKEVELKEAEEALQRRKTQLQQATSNKEYQALKDQIAASEVTNSVLADEALDALMKVDELTAKLAEAEAALARARQEADKVQQEFRQREPGLRAEIQRLEAELTQLEAQLPADFRQLYLRVVRTKGIDALGQLDGEFCSGCNQHVPINMQAKLLLGEPVMCRSCGRLLYLPEDARVVKSAPASDGA